MTETTTVFLVNIFNVYVAPYAIPALYRYSGVDSKHKMCYEGKLAFLLMLSGQRNISLNVKSRVQ